MVKLFFSTYKLIGHIFAIRVIILDLAKTSIAKLTAMNFILTLTIIIAMFMQVSIIVLFVSHIVILPFF
jgi:hypothetical protein